MIGSNEDLKNLLKNCENNKAGLEDIKAFEDKKPEVDLLSIAAAEAVKNESLIGGKDDW